MMKILKTSLKTNMEQTTLTSLLTDKKRSSVMHIIEQCDSFVISHTKYYRLQTLEQYKEH